MPAHGPSTRPPLHKTLHKTVVEFFSRKPKEKPRVEPTIRDIHEAAEEGHLDSVKALLDADPSLVKSIRKKDGCTPMHCAAMRGHVAIIQLLSDRGGDVKAIDARERTPLHYAVTAKNKDGVPSGNKEGVIRLLVRRGADINAQNDSGETPWHLSAHGNYREINSLMRRLLAKPTIRNKDGPRGKTPLEVEEEMRKRPR